MSIVKNFYNQIVNVLNNGVFGISLFDLGIIFTSIIFALLFRSIFAKLIVLKVKKVVKKTTTNVDDRLFDALIPPFKLLPIVIVFLAVTLYFEIDSTLGLYFQKINNTLSTIFVFWLIHQVLIPFSNIFSKLEKILTKALVLWIVQSLKYIIIFLGIVAVLEVWGIKIGPVIAGLGLFGVAVALGAQDLFKNLISGVMILLEKRFHIGDVIKLPGITEGTVEHIGFRSTLIRKFDSSPIAIPNYVFAETSILNYSRRIHRRIKWIIGLEYESDIKDLKNFIKSLEEFIKNNKNFIVNDNYQLFIKIDKFNDSSIDILVYCFVNTNIWENYLIIKEDLAFQIKKLVYENNLDFAFPTQKIFIEK